MKLKLSFALFEAQFYPNRVIISQFKASFRYYTQIFINLAQLFYDRLVIFFIFIVLLYLKTGPAVPLTGLYRAAPTAT